MLRISFIVFISFIFFHSFVYAQPTSTIGAKSWGLGGASVSDETIFSTQNNPAAITYLQNIQAGIYSENRFMISNLGLHSVSLVIPFRWVHVGILVNHFGYSAFNQQKISLSMAKKLSSTFSLGANISYMRLNIAEQEGAGNVLIETGVYYKPQKNLTVGMLLFNPTQNKYSTNAVDKIPTFARLGLRYELNKKIQLLAESNKTLGEDLINRFGIDYQILPSFALRCGFANNPLYYTFGCSIKYKKTHFDFASSVHEILGLSPHFSMSMPIN